MSKNKFQRSNTGSAIPVLFHLFICICWPEIVCYIIHITILQYHVIYLTKILFKRLIIRSNASITSNIDRSNCSELDIVPSDAAIMISSLLKLLTGIEQTRQSKFSFSKSLFPWFVGFHLNSGHAVYQTVAKKWTISWQFRARTTSRLQHRSSKITRESDGIVEI